MSPKSFRRGGRQYLQSRVAASGAARDKPHPSPRPEQAHDRVIREELPAADDRHPYRDANLDNDVTEVPGAAF